jgi:hypothetical protein
VQVCKANAAFIEPQPRRRRFAAASVGSGIRKQPRISLGTYLAVSLQQARERAAECRALVANGIDLRQKRRDEKYCDALAQINTSKGAAEYWYKHKAEAGRATATLAKIRTYLDKDILPELGDKPLQHTTHADCARLQEPIENRDAHKVAKKTRGWLKQIFSQAIARGLCENNPASELRAIAAAGPAVKHHPHLTRVDWLDMAHGIPPAPCSVNTDGLSRQRKIANLRSWSTGAPVARSAYTTS